MEGEGEAKRKAGVEGVGIQDLGGGSSASPISSSHYLSSMNGFWHQRQKKQSQNPAAVFVECPV